VPFKLPWGGGEQGGLTWTTVEEGDLPGADDAGVGVKKAKVGEPQVIHNRQIEEPSETAGDGSAVHQGDAPEDPTPAQNPVKVSRREFMVGAATGAAAGAAASVGLTRFVQNQQEGIPVNEFLGRYYQARTRLIDAGLANLLPSLDANLLYSFLTNGAGDYHQLGSIAQQLQNVGYLNEQQEGTLRGVIETEDNSSLESNLLARAKQNALKASEGASVIIAEDRDREIVNKQLSVKELATTNPRLAILKASVLQDPETAARWEASVGRLDYAVRFGGTLGEIALIDQVIDILDPEAVLGTLLPYVSTAMAERYINEVTSALISPLIEFADGQGENVTGSYFSQRLVETVINDNPYLTQQYNFAQLLAKDLYSATVSPKGVSSIGSSTYDDMLGIALQELGIDSTNETQLLDFMGERESDLFVQRSIQVLARHYVAAYKQAIFQGDEAVIAKLKQSPTLQKLGLYIGAALNTTASNTKAYREATRDLLSRGTYEEYIQQNLLELQTRQLEELSGKMQVLEDMTGVKTSGVFLYHGQSSESQYAGSLEEAQAILHSGDPTITDVFATYQLNGSNGHPVEVILKADIRPHADVGVNMAVLHNPLLTAQDGLPATDAADKLVNEANSLTYRPATSISTNFFEVPQFERGLVVNGYEVQFLHPYKYYQTGPFALNTSTVERLAQASKSSKAVAYARLGELELLRVVVGYEAETEFSAIIKPSGIMSNDGYDGLRIADIQQTNGTLVFESYNELSESPKPTKRELRITSPEYAKTIVAQMDQLTPAFNPVHISIKAASPMFNTEGQPIKYCTFNITYVSKQDESHVLVSQVVVPLNIISINDPTIEL